MPSVHEPRSCKPASECHARELPLGAGQTDRHETKPPRAVRHLQTQGKLLQPGRLPRCPCEYPAGSRWTAAGRGGSRTDPGWRPQDVWSPTSWPFQLGETPSRHLSHVPPAPARRVRLAPPHVSATCLCFPPFLSSNAGYLQQPVSQL